MKYVKILFMIIIDFIRIPQHYVLLLNITLSYVANYRGVQFDINTAYGQTNI